MAQTENGVGVSYKLSDGTMVWARRDTYAELTEDIRLVFGDGALERLEEQTHRAWGANKPAPQTVQAAPALTVVPDEPTAEVVAAELGATVGQTTSYETCRVCGGLKDRWVAPGVSKKTGKAYPGFFGCSTPRCPGR